MKIDILKKTNIFHYFPSKNLKYSQIFLSETIHAQENGSRGPHFAKSLNSNFLKGLTYSAVALYIGQKWFPRPYFPLIWGMFVLRSGLRFSFWALEVPFPRVRKRPISLTKMKWSGAKIS